jgi:general secretion pathway protein H
MRSKGFTLVEILVVVVIMAVVISLAVLSIGVTGRDNQLDQEGRRIQALIDLLHERALLEGRDFGVSIQPNAYDFLVYDTIRDQWARFDLENEFRHRDLPKGVTFQLQLDQQPVVLKAPDKALSGGTLQAPQLAIAASGEGTPFRLILQRDATQAQAAVNGDAMGKLSLDTSDHAKTDKSGHSVGQSPAKRG